MRFHQLVRGSLRRLAAAILMALLAWPVAAPASPPVTREQPVRSAHSDGMTATPAHAAAAEVAIAPAGMAAPPASAIERVVVSNHPLVCRTTADRPTRRPAAVKPAPTVLRV
jgi:hypothetical protein